MQTEKFWEILTAEDMTLAQKLLNLIGKKSKPVLLKKNILDKNKEHHPHRS